MSFADLSTSGLLTFLILAFAAIGFIKGLVRTVFMLLTLAGSGLAGYLAWHNGTGFVRQWWAGAPDSAGQVLSVVVAIGAFYLLHKLFDFLVNPFEEHSLISRVAFGLPASLVSLAVAIGAMWLGLNKFREHASLAEMELLLQRRSGEQGKLPLSCQLKHLLENSKVGGVVAQLDPFVDKAKLTLAKLAIIRDNQDDYDTLAQDDAIAKALRHPKVWELINDKGIASLIAEQSFDELLNDPRLDDILKDEELKTALEGIDIEKSLEVL